MAGFPTGGAAHYRANAVINNKMYFIKELAARDGPINLVLWLSEKYLTFARQIMTNLPQPTVSSMARLVIYI